MVASLPGGEVTVNRLSWTATFSNLLYFIPEMKPILCINEICVSDVCSENLLTTCGCMCLDSAFKIVYGLFYVSLFSSVLTGIHCISLS